MKTQLRHLIADALYPTKAHNLPSVCERFGLEPGTGEEAFSSKTRYIMKRLEKLSDDKVFAIAKRVVEDFPDDKLVAAVEKIVKDGHLITDITRNHIAKALDDFSIAGDQDILELLRKHWPLIDHEGSKYRAFATIADDIQQHVILNDDWFSSDILRTVGFFEGSQARLFGFLEDTVHPIRRRPEEQEKIVAALNPILKRDGYCLLPSKPVSGYPTYKIAEVTPGGTQPADDLISKALISFDESGVHQAWQKALERRSNDPEGAITAAKTLLETVCKHIIEEAGGQYGANDDLPKLYGVAAECLNLAPSQHTEVVFKTILGNCQSVVGNLAGLRNKLGDSHGQGKRHVKPQARHAELAVNLAGSIAMFLVATWNVRKG